MIQLLNSVRWLLVIFFVCMGLMKEEQEGIWENRLEHWLKTVDARQFVRCAKCNKGLTAGIAKKKFPYYWCYRKGCRAVFVPGPSAHPCIIIVRWQDARRIRLRLCAGRSEQPVATQAQLLTEMSELLTKADMPSKYENFSWTSEICVTICRLGLAMVLCYQP